MLLIRRMKEVFKKLHIIFEWNTVIKIVLVIIVEIDSSGLGLLASAYRLARGTPCLSTSRQYFAIKPDDFTTNTLSDF